MLEAMGAEYYAYFDLPDESAVNGVADAARRTTDGDPVGRRRGSQLIARLPIDSEVHERKPIELWFDPGAAARVRSRDRSSGSPKSSVSRDRSRTARGTTAAGGPVALDGFASRPPVSAGARRVGDQRRAVGRAPRGQPPAAPPRGDRPPRGGRQLRQPPGGRRSEFGAIPRAGVHGLRRLQVAGGARLGARAPPDPELAREADEAIALVAAAQEDDGYLNSYYQVARPGERFSNLAHDHELYCAGHLIQAAIAHAPSARRRTSAARSPSASWSTSTRCSGSPAGRARPGIPRSRPRSSSSTG